MASVQNQPGAVGIKVYVLIIKEARSDSKAKPQ